jgi:hypothetical protein
MPKSAMCARRIAEGQVDLGRVRRARRELMARVLAHPNDRVSPHVLTELARALDVMDRYERRARSHRKFAIRDFDKARAAGLAKQSHAKPPAAVLAKQSQTAPRAPRIDGWSIGSRYVIGPA